MPHREIETIGLDADDTLWHNEIHFQQGQERLAGIVAPFANRETLGQKLLDIEHRNLKLYGYGIKGFTLSMIEAAVDLSDRTISGGAIREIIDIGREMLAMRIDPLPGVIETLQALKGRYRLIVITKGDLLDQEAKIARSGLGDLIDDVHIVSEKTPDVYVRAFGGNRNTSQSVMIGNSLKSDVLPAIAAGAYGIHIPYQVTWAHEQAEEPIGSDRYHRFSRFEEVLDWLDAA